MIPSTFTSSDNKSTVHVRTWPVENPRAVLQITHGMSEYIERYNDFACFLNERGIYVLGHDHIGHGKSAERKDYGYFGKKDGWTVLASDVEKLYKLGREEFKDIPYFVMGHSMGSFVARTWFAMFKEKPNGVIFMGTAGENKAIGAGKALVKLLEIFKGDRAKSKLVTIMAFGKYNAKIKNYKTYNDWLTRDQAVVDAYVADPDCGFTFTLGGYNDLFSLLEYINKDSWYKDVPKDVPVLVIAGTADPVGEYGKGPAEVAEKLQDAGCEDVSLLLYEGMRHEILNEYGKEAVMEDLKKFILDEECEGQQEE